MIKSKADLALQNTRARVLAAVERLFDTGAGDFSVRELAAEAAVSFATPFNQFGGEVAIMQPLSAGRIGI